MVNIAVSLFSIILLCNIAPQARKELNAYYELPASSPITNDGICNTIVEKQSYICEEHKVTTEDGYILSLQRMPAGRSGKRADKPPVLLQHGVLIDAVAWLFNSPDASLPFILADNGFDVWLANSRGTRYSNGHTSLTPNDEAYWDWSFDELVSYDLPAVVEYVYNHTGHRMHYVGHSMGTTMALGALSQQQLLDMLTSAALLCPIARMNQITSKPIKFAADVFIADDLYWLGHHEFFRNGDVASKFLKGVCHNLNLNCSNLMSVFTGPNCCLNSSMIDVYLDNEPQPTSTKNLIQISQMVRTGILAKYDYGDQEQNMQHYGQPSPPLYDMSSIPNEFPLLITYGGQDMLSDVNDVQLLLNDLKNHDGDKLVLVYIEDYAHADFVMGVNANKLIYDPVMAFFKAN